MKTTITPLLVMTLVCVVQSDVSVIVQSPFGQIKGIRSKAKNNQSYVMFRGIPYAVPPVGELRFAKPVPHPRLTKQFDATLQPLACIQDQVWLLPGEEMSENCLTLNIFVTDVNTYPRKPRKVLIWVHGGGFFGGSSLPYETVSFVTENDVVVVAIQYRLGLLGFLSTENEASLGNYGMWDQVLAIKWIKDNIAYFGGDPGDMAIVGESAGATSVSLLALSSATKGLFTKVYLSSGTATATYSKYPNAKTDALKVAKTLNCWIGDLDEDIDVAQGNNIIECLRTRPAIEITKVVNLTIPKMVSPRVDGDFLPNSPSKLLNDDNYLESIGFYSRSYLTSFNNNEQSLLNYFFAFQKSLIFNRNDLHEIERKEIWENIKTESFKDHVGRRLDIKDPSPELVSLVVDWYQNRFHGDAAFDAFFADLFFIIPNFDWVNALSKRSNTSSWFLYFNHYPRYIKGPQRGTVHVLDLCYWIDIPLDYVKLFTNITTEGGFDREELKLKKMFSSLVADFIAMGDPSKSLKIAGGWPKYSTAGDDYLDFNLRPSVQNKLLWERRQFWNDVESFGRKLQNQKEKYGRE